MPHEKIARLSGVPQVNHTKGSDFDHDGHMTSGHHSTDEIRAPGSDGRARYEMRKISGERV